MHNIKRPAVKRAKAIAVPAALMNRRAFLLAAAAALTALVAAFAVSPARAAGDGVIHLTAREAAKYIAENPGVQIIDVRTGGEFRSGHLKGAVNINYFALDFKSQVSKFDRDKPYLVHCKTGIRSTRAVNIMRSLGFTTIYHMDGGTDAWTAAGLPLVTD